MEAAAELVPGGSAFTKLYPGDAPTEGRSGTEGVAGRDFERTNEHGRLLEEHERSVGTIETLTGLPAAHREVDDRRGVRTGWGQMH